MAVNVSWPKNPESDIASYVLQRGDLVSGPFATIATIVYDPLLSTYTYSDPGGTVDSWYRLAAIDSVGQQSDWSNPFPASGEPTWAGFVTLAELREAAKQRADMIHSGFITDLEWNGLINGSIAELYDLLVQKWGEDYFFKEVQTTSDGVSPTIPLPPDFYKLMGVDLRYSGAPDGWVSLRQFQFAERNRASYPSMPASPFGGLVNTRYRVNGKSILFSPTPGAGQVFRFWYVPRVPKLVNDTDEMDFVSGWEEYVIVDAAIKAMAKEESDVSVLMAQKGALVQRIEAAAANRDGGAPATVSDVRDDGTGWNGMGGFF